MIRLLPVATLLFAALTVAPACAYEQPYQRGWAPAPSHVWYQRPSPPPRWGWRAPPARRWAPPPHARGWGGPAPRADRGWGAPRATRYEHRRREAHHDRRRDDRRW